MIRIYDHHNKQWLEPMSIFFGDDGFIWKVDAKIPGQDPVSDGWYSLRGDDLKKISIIGGIDYNTELLNQQT